MLPDNAKVYFDQLCTARLTDESVAHAKALKEFDRAISARGVGRNSGAYIRGLADLFAQDFDRRVQIVVDALKEAHHGFEGPLDEGVENQLVDWGMRTLSGIFAGLDGAFVRHVERSGVRTSLGSGLSSKYSLAQVHLTNIINHHIWSLRHVPINQPKAPSPPTIQVTNNGGVIGAIQAGAGSVAHVQQQWATGDVTPLRDALDVMRLALLREPSLDKDTQQALVTNVDSALVELRADSPRKTHLWTLLGGLALAVQTIPNVKPAWETIKTAAKAIGLDLP